MLFNGNSTILQLYRGEKKLHFNKMIIKYSNNNGRTYHKKSRIFWPLSCLFFFDIRILIAPLVSSNSSYNLHPTLCKINIHRTCWMFAFRINNSIYHHSKINFSSLCCSGITKEYDRVASWLWRATTVINLSAVVIWQIEAKKSLKIPKA